MTAIELKPRVAGNNNTNALKIIALVFMVCDHFGKMLLPGVPEMRMFGRIAFPLYCYCIVVGACYTKSFPRYALRLLIIGAASQPLYMLALNHTWAEPNIFLTLLLGVLALYAIKEKRFYSHLYLPPIALVLAELLGCDYGWRGVLLIMLLYLAKDTRSAIAAVMIAFCLFWGGGGSAISSFFGLPLPFLSFKGIGPILTPFFKLQALALFSLPFMLIPMRFQFKMNKWLGYALYPAHLALLILLKQL